MYQVVAQQYVTKEECQKQLADNHKYQTPCIGPHDEKTPNMLWAQIRQRSKLGKR